MLTSQLATVTAVLASLSKAHLKYRMIAMKTSAAPTQDTTVTCMQHSQSIETLFRTCMAYQMDTCRVQGMTHQMQAAKRPCFNGGIHRNNRSQSRRRSSSLHVCC